MPYADPYLLPMAALLTAVGLTEIYRLDPEDAFRQGLWIVIGVGALRRDAPDAAPRLPRARDVQVPLRPRRDRAAASCPRCPGSATTVNGARLWVDLGPFQFQPGELAKLSLIVFLAGYLREKREVLAQGRLKDFGPLLLIWGGAMLVLVETNDLGSGLLYFGVFLAMLYVATARDVRGDRAGALRRRRRGVVYQVVRRVRTASRSGCRPGRSRDREGYQLVQSLYSIGNGGFGGTGLGKGTFTTAGGDTQLIPYLNTDFIYSALAQELGLIGVAALLLVYMLFVARGFRIALLAEDGFSKLLAAGPDVRVRAADVHHRRRDPPADPAHRDHAAVRLVRRVERPGELRPARGPDARLEPRERAEGADEPPDHPPRVFSLVLLVRADRRDDVLADVGGRRARRRGRTTRSSASRSSRSTAGGSTRRDGKTVLATNVAEGQGQDALLPPLPAGAARAARRRLLDAGALARGLEQSMNDYLTGSNANLSHGRRHDARPAHTARRHGQRPRADARRRAQRARADALEGQCGAAVALDPKTGRVLVMASSPTYDPNLVERNFGRIQNRAQARARPPRRCSTARRRASTRPARRSRS